MSKDRKAEKEIAGQQAEDSAAGTRELLEIVSNFPGSENHPAVTNAKEVLDEHKALNHAEAQDQGAQGQN